MLSKLQIDAIKPTSKLQKIYDSEMLYLFVSPTGRKTWKVLYTLGGKKNTITLGEYPKVMNAKDARLRRDEIKKQISKGINPTEQKTTGKNQRFIGNELCRLDTDLYGKSHTTQKGWACGNYNFE